MPDIRERNDRPKDKQPKHRTASAVQRQMVQKFVKELNDSAKQSDRSGSAETTATEQVEKTAREIAREAVQLPRRAIQHPARKESTDSSANAQPEQSVQPHHAPESKQPQSTLTPAPQEQARRAYVRQTAKAATTAPPITPEQSQSQHSTVTAPSAENALRTRPELQRPQSAPAPTPQEQGRRAYVRRAKKSRAEKRLRWIICIRSSRKSGLRIVLRRKKFRRFVKSRKHRKSAVKYIPKPHQQNRPLFAMKSSRTHGHHAARRLQLCAAKSSLFVSGQQSHSRTIYRPFRRRRHGKPL